MITTTPAMTRTRGRSGAAALRAFSHGIALLERFPTSLLALTFRFAVAVVFWRSGMTKLANWDLTVALFQNEYAVPLLPPELAATLAATAELACPVLLVLGLGTRFAAAALLGMTTVIQLFVFPENWPDHLLWASILAYLVTRGAGVLSLDHLLRRLSGEKAAGAR
jgi:putative oxidoreductase